MSIAFDLDHVALLVEDLDAASVLYRRLGFGLTARSSHKGLAADGTVEPWGTGNHCAMFARGYLEILGITDRRLKHDHVAARLRRYPGLHLIAFGTSNARGTAATLRARGVPGIADPIVVGRDVPFGTGTKPGSFAIVHLDAALYPEANFLIIEHKTRDALWQPDLLAHPNGVLALRSVTIAVDRPAESVARLAPILGQPRQSSFALLPGVLEFVSSADLLARYPGIEQPMPARKVVAMTFTVGALPETMAALRQGDVDFERIDRNTIRVGAAAAAGAIIDFVVDA